MINILSVFWFLAFVKLLLFWLWLWQLKEYHTGRFRAHFEAQKIKKFFSSFWRLKYPKFTLKIIIVFLTGIITVIFWLLFLPGLLLLILAPLIISTLVLLFQIPTIIWRRIMIEKAKRKRVGFKDLIVVGITGSYGKTSTKEFLAAILSEKFRVLKTKEHQNSEIGIAKCILNELKPEHEVFIVEMGAYQLGGIKLLCDITKPRIAVLTGINEQHLSTFSSLENIIKTKYEIIESLPKDGVAFFNARNKYCLELYQKTDIKKRIYGQNILSALLQQKEMPGMENIEGAKAVARELGMTEEEISRAVEKIENKFPGIQIKKGVNGLNIIDASYSANPDGVLAHLDYLSTFTGKKIIVMPCLIELGKAAKEVHQRIGERIAHVCDLAIITTKDYFKELKGNSDKIIYIENPKEIFKKIKEFAQPGDTILLEGRVPTEFKNLLIVQ